MTAKALDPRINAFRTDLASEALRSQVAAPRYVPGKIYQVQSPSAPLRRAPSFEAPLDTEVLQGERLTVYDEKEGWTWAQAERDNYVGYVPSAHLTKEIMEPGHRVGVIRTFLFPAPDIKTPPLSTLSLNALLCVSGEADDFLELETGGYIYKRHVCEAGEFDADFVDVAERFVGTPYLWGGRQSLGVDCSGLVQIACQATGLKAPRDSDMQEEELGAKLDFSPGLRGLIRGDLIFWKGHVGIMVDGSHLLHANAHHMATTIEPLAEVVKRIGASGSEITNVRRVKTL